MGVKSSKLLALFDKHQRVETRGDPTALESFEEISQKFIDLIELSTPYFPFLKKLLV